MTRPNSRVVEIAIEAALKSPCQKSRRGVVIYTDRAIIGTGWNGPPEPGRCGVDQPCGAGAIRKGDLSACSMVCMHAEARAIADAGRGLKGAGVQCWGVHVAVNGAGVLLAGGGPSCWQCSRLVLEAKLERFWLYEGAPQGATGPYWRAYTAEEFHRQTLISCGLLEPTPLPVHVAGHAPQIALEPRSRCGKCGGPMDPDDDCQRCYPRNG